MGDLFASLIMTLLDWVKKNYKKPRLWIMIIIVVVVMFWLIPYIDSNFFYYDRMEKRISILQQLTELDQEKIDSNKILQKEYENILGDIQVQEDRMVSSMVTNISNAINTFFNVKPQKGNVWIKFLSGAVLSLIIAFFIPFMNTFKSNKQKVSALILMLIIALSLGGVGAIVPIIIHPYVNYWGMPIFQLVGLIILALRFGENGKV